MSSLQTLRWGALGATAALLLTACGTDADSPTKPATSETGGYAGARAALLAMDPDGSTAGALMLVNADGTVRSVPVTALPGATPVRTGNSIGLTAVENDLRMDSSRTQFVPHSWTMEQVEDSLAVKSTPWTFGTSGGDLDVVAGRGERSEPSTFFAQSTARVACGREVIGVLADDEADLATRSVRLVRYRLVEDRVVTNTDKVPAPTLVGDARVACLEEGRVVLAHDSAGKPRIAQEQGEGWVWSTAPARVVGRDWGTVRGVFGSSVVLQTESGLRAWDTETRTMRQLVSWPRGSGEASVQGEQAVVWVGGTNPELTVVDLRTGKSSGSIPTDQLVERLARDGRELRGAPVLLD